MDCLLSPEIGLYIPAVFVFDDTEINLRNRRKLGCVHYFDGTVVDTLLLNHSIVVELLPGGTRQPESNRLPGQASSAYYIQRLFSAFTTDS